jgi:hypothetical protein
MLSKCANPSCCNEFRYFGEGKVFEIRLGEGPRSPAANTTKTESIDKRSKTIEHFWLCSACSPTLTIATDRARNVLVVPRKPGRVRTAIAS